VAVVVTFSAPRSTVALPKSVDTLRTAQLQVGMGFLFSVHGSIGSAYQRKSFIGSKK
jgi:hypothetical protein